MIGKRKRGASKASNAFKRLKPVDEVTFDFNAREDYLTGFHKRKLQRAKHAQEQAAKQEREDRIQQRKELRETRQKELQEHVKAVNHAVRRAEGLDSASEDDDEEQGEAWQGINEPAAKVVRREDEYSDSDDEQEATVTVEAVDVDRDGLHAVKSGSEDEDEAEAKDKTADSAAKPPQPEARSDAKRQPGSKRVWTKEKPKVPKTRKKKFRYETKADRKVTRAKEKASKAKKRPKKEE